AALAQHGRTERAVPVAVRLARAALPGRVGGTGHRHAIPRSPLCPSLTDGTRLPTPGGRAALDGVGGGGAGRAGPGRAGGPRQPPEPEPERAEEACAGSGSPCVDLAGGSHADDQSADESTRAGVRSVSKRRHREASRQPSESYTTSWSTSLDLAGDRSLLVPVRQHVLYGAGLPWPYILSGMFRDLLRGMVYVLAFPGLLIFMCVCVAIRCLKHTHCFRKAEPSRLLRLRRQVLTWNKAAIMRRTVCSFILLWPPAYQIYKQEDSSICSTADVLRPCLLLAFGISYTHRARKFVSRVKAAVAAYQDPTDVATSSSRYSAVSPALRLSEQHGKGEVCEDQSAHRIRDQMKFKGYKSGLDWPSWDEQPYCSISLKGFVIAATGALVPQLGKVIESHLIGHHLLASHISVPQSSLDVLAIVTNMIATFFIWKNLVSHGTWCLLASKQQTINKKVFCALTSIEQLEQLHDMVCIDAYGHARDEPCTACAGCKLFPRMIVTTFRGLTVWYNLRKRVSYNWVYPRVQTEVFMSASCLMCLCEFTLVVWKFIAVSHMSDAQEDGYKLGAMLSSFLSNPARRRIFCPRSRNTERASRIGQRGPE
ncbi:unnamed protein product, partial [Prorocentrum cordatum]